MKHEELIEKYIQNSLSPKEKLSLEELLKSNTLFKEEFILHTNLKKVIESEDDTNFRLMVADLEQRAKLKQPTHSNTKWIVAASVALLLGLAYFFTTNQKVSTDELFAQNFKPYQNVIAPMVRSGHSNGEQIDTKTQAFLAYEKGEYDKAISLFSKLYEKTKEPYYLFYKANALLKLDRAQDAIPLLLKHLKTNDTLKEKTNWYLALAYLKLKEKQKAKEILKKVVATKAYKNKEAQKLIHEFE